MSVRAIATNLRHENYSFKQAAKTAETTQKQGDICSEGPSPLTALRPTLSHPAQLREEPSLGRLAGSWDPHLNGTVHTAGLGPYHIFRVAWHPQQSCQQ